MSILRIRYANQLAVSEFDLEDQVNLMLGEAAIAKAILGTTTELDGFECTPTAPPSLTVDVAGGTIFSFENVLDSALGQLPTQIPSDTTHQILKYAYELDSTPFTITPPATVGNSRNDLIQIGFAEADGNPADIPFFNGFTGQTINPPTFQNLDTQRIDSVVISVKNGVAAPTGTQVTPTPDAGFIGAWVVTTANGQTTITSGDIAEFTNAPFLTEKLKDKISQAFADERYVIKDTVAMRVHQNTPQTITSGNSAFLSFQVEDFDTKNYFNTSTGRFTPLVAGYYQVTASVGLVVGSGTSSVEAEIFKNGVVQSTDVDYGDSTIDGGRFACNSNDLIFMNGTTDFLQVHVANIGPNSVNTDTSPNRTYFSAILIATP